VGSRWPQGVSIAWRHGHLSPTRDHPADERLKAGIEIAAGALEDNFVGRGAAPALAQIVQPAGSRYLAPSRPASSSVAANETLTMIDPITTE
jgi:hypothetical protein